MRGAREASAEVASLLLTPFLLPMRDHCAPVCQRVHEQLVKKVVHDALEERHGDVLLWAGLVSLLSTPRAQQGC